MEKIIAYNGFDKDLKIRGSQYEVDKWFEFNDYEYYEDGFSSYLNPLKVLEDYDPANSRFCEVEHGGEMINEDDDTIVSKKIFIKREFDLYELVKSAIYYTNKNVN